MASELKSGFSRGTFNPPFEPLKTPAPFMGDSDEIGQRFQNASAERACPRGKIDSVSYQRAIDSSSGRIEQRGFADERVAADQRQSRAGQRQAVREAVAPVDDG